MRGPQDAVMHGGKLNTCIYQYARGIQPVPHPGTFVRLARFDSAHSVSSPHRLPAVALVPEQLGPQAEAPNSMLPVDPRPSLVLGIVRGLATVCPSLLGLLA